LEQFRETIRANIDDNKLLMMEKLVDIWEVADSMLNVIEKCTDKILEKVEPDDGKLSLKPIFTAETLA